MPRLFVFSPLNLFIALENLIDCVAIHLRREEADNPDDGEAANHGDGSAVDGIDRIA